VGGQGPDGAVAPYMDGFVRIRHSDGTDNVHSVGAIK
jgi:hypothetical protein